jgi:hypothetical protein
MKILHLNGGNMGKHRPKSKREFEESVSFGKARGEG